MPEADSSPKKLEPRVGGFRWHTCFSSLWGKGQGPGDVSYITNTTESAVSLLNLHFLLSSAVKIAPMFCWILRISVHGSYNLFFFFPPQQKMLDLPPTLLVANMFKPTYQPQKSLIAVEKYNETQHSIALHWSAHVYQIQLEWTWQSVSITSLSCQESTLKDVKSW